MFQNARVFNAKNSNCYDAAVKLQNHTINEFQNKIGPIDPTFKSSLLTRTRKVVEKKRKSLEPATFSTTITIPIKEEVEISTHTDTQGSSGKKGKRGPKKRS
jgi:hypothetical protein